MGIRESWEKLVTGSTRQQKEMKWIEAIRAFNNDPQVRELHNTYINEVSRALFEALPKIKLASDRDGMPDYVTLPEYPKSLDRYFGQHPDVSDIMQSLSYLDDVKRATYEQVKDAVKLHMGSPASHLADELKKSMENYLVMDSPSTQRAARIIDTLEDIGWRNPRGGELNEQTLPMFTRERLPYAEIKKPNPSWGRFDNDLTMTKIQFSTIPEVKKLLETITRAADKSGLFAAEIKLFGDLGRAA